MRILAHMTRDPELVRAYATDKDIHALTARRLYGKAEGEAVSEEERQIGKRVNFGVIYGMVGERDKRRERGGG